MLKKEITYTNFDGETVTEPFYFNMTKAELMELQITEKEGFDVRLKRIAASKDPAQIIAEFKRIILMAYGEKSEDGRSFVKTKEAADAFATTEAFSELFMELSQDADAAADFVNGLVPADLTKEGQEALASLEGKGPAPEPEKKWDDYTKEELLNMPQDQFQRLVGTDANKMNKAQLVVAMERRNKE